MRNFVEFQLIVVVFVLVFVFYYDDAHQWPESAMTGCPPQGHSSKEPVTLFPMSRSLKDLSHGWLWTTWGLKMGSSLWLTITRTVTDSLSLQSSTVHTQAKTKRLMCASCFFNATISILRQGLGLLAELTVSTSTFPTQDVLNKFLWDNPNSSTIKPYCPGYEKGHPESEQEGCNGYLPCSGWKNVL